LEISRDIDVRAASKLYGMSEDRLKARFVKEEFRTARKERNKWWVKRSEVEWKLLRDKSTGLDILKRFKDFGDLPVHIKPSVEQLEDFLGDDPVCLASLPGGVPWALMLMAYLVDSRGKDVTLIVLSDREESDREDIVGTKVLLVDDISVTGNSMERAKTIMAARKTQLDIKDVKSFIYDDFQEIADFWVRRVHDEYRRTIALNFRRPDLGLT